MSESQLLSTDGSAACSESTASSSSFLSTSSSPSPSDSCSSSGSSGYCDKEPHVNKGRRSKRRLQSRSDCEEIKKKVKNAREKERVLAVRHEYDELAAVLGDRVERGSGHFSKVGTLAAAIRCIEDLMKVRGQLATDDVPTPSQQSRSEESVSPEISSADISPGDPEVSLSCDERLEPVEIHDLDPLDLATVPPIFSTTPYFSYSSPSDFPPNSSCMFPFPGSSPGLPPPSSLLCSPELAGHPPLPTIPMPETLSPLGMSPPPPHPYQCGSDVWLAIGCN